MDLQALHAAYEDCTRCRLSDHRCRIVLGEGNPAADLILVGEAPGAEEDRTGRPFVGRSGQLLDKILHAAGIARSEVFITSVIKCRPPRNRMPQKDEIDTCLPILRQQFVLMQPKIVVILGSVAARALLGNEVRITQIRGRWLERKGLYFLPTYHPAYLLRSPAKKAEAWEDWQTIAAAYREKIWEKKEDV